MVRNQSAQNVQAKRQNRRAARVARRNTPQRVALRENIKKTLKTGMQQALKLPMSRLSLRDVPASGWLSKISGVGDYKVQMNSITMGTPVPTFTNGKRSIVISHREYLQDVSASTGFVLSSFALNPGLSTSFPWLAQVARAFQQYRFHGLVFEFLSTSADALNNVNTSLGTVVLSTNYNATRPVFLSKQEMDSYEFTVATRPANSIIHPIECAPLEAPTNLWYIRSGNIPSSQDLRFYDLGLFQLATTGMQSAASIIGELWVSYEVELFKPGLPASPQSGASSSAQLSTTGQNSANPFGSAVTTLSGTLSYVSVTGAVITFGPQITDGTYIIEFLPNFTAGSVLTLTTPTLSNCTNAGSGWSNPALWAPTTGSTAANAALTIIVTISGFNTAGSTVTLGGLTLGTFSSSSIQVTAIPTSNVIY